MSILFPRAMTYELHGEGGYNSTTGEWEAGTKTTHEIKGDVQPLSGKDIISLPQGRDNNGLVKVYTNVQLTVATPGGKEPGTIIMWEGQKWELIQEMSRNAGVIEHYKYLAQLRGASE